MRWRRQRQPEDSAEERLQRELAHLRALEAELREALSASGEDARHLVEGAKAEAERTLADLDRELHAAEHRLRSDIETEGARALQAIQDEARRQIARLRSLRGRQPEKSRAEDGDAEAGGEDTGSGAPDPGRQRTHRDRGSPTDSEEPP